MNIHRGSKVNSRTLAQSTAPLYMGTLQGASERLHWDRIVERFMGTTVKGKGVKDDKCAKVYIV